MDQSALRSLSQCPVCLEVRRDAPIYQCSNGHLICGPCKARDEVTYCPTGRCPFDDPPRRNRLVERIIELAAFDFPCRYSSDGCDFVGGRTDLREHEEEACDFRLISCKFINCSKSLRPKEMERHLMEDHLYCTHSANGCEFTGTRSHLLWHEDECVFRSVHCPDGNCNRTVKVAQVLDHIKAEHKDAVWNKSPIKVDVGDIQDLSLPLAQFHCRWNVQELQQRRPWHLVAHEVDDVLFLAHFHRSADGLYYLWLQTLGSRRVAGNYTCDMELMGKTLTVHHKGKVFPIDMSREEITWDERCLQATERIIRQCVNERNEVLEVKFTLAKKTKPES